MRKNLVLLLCVLILVSVAAAQQAGGEKKPPLSPRRQAETSFADGKKVMVDYGAPSMRGRKIMGELVPYGKVWRTGANAATTFTTDADLMINGTRVPAGKYSLYTMPDADNWKLIINENTGQWGTQYDEKQDLARVDMTKTATAQPVEQMTFSFDKAGADGATMKLQWENTQLSVPLKEAK
ncbi:MAG TPA: DUF2911 domain-containing protein [Clostridia bacterium]|nr:DUF2911 domain-containing protein [Clostridia bacterium]